ncbi:hypothetical protein QQS21_002750 [Conoideocrella luteorostrata]|uniref:Uncharacterized protein n=1 Tax=Conoideocrella luteorostrata TaxID=1105319 RepID=A0AAJ0CUS7_9HYPO|nr:hypothetical protein QQS21_002750 [Conoideocrella luteorostrata]
MGNLSEDAEVVRDLAIGGDASPPSTYSTYFSPSASISPPQDQSTDFDHSSLQNDEQSTVLHYTHNPNLDSAGCIPKPACKYPAFHSHDDSQDHSPVIPKTPSVSYLHSPENNIISPIVSIHNPESSGIIHLSSPKWPITEHQEAMLFRYFIDKLSPLFDMCDDERHFEKIVPRRAVFCPPLMNAMLAASAKLLSRLDGFDGVTVDKYHQDCLNALIPAMSSSAAAMDENLLPAIVILRYMEELDEPLTAPAPESHLLGTRVFVAAQEDMCGSTGLWRAAYWLALRQEIHFAFVQTRPIHSSFVLEKAEQVIRQDDDDSGCSYANLMILQCAACIRYCYGSDTQSHLAWQSLKDRLDILWQNRPWMFYPMHAQDHLPDALPVQQYLNSAVVTGVQHWLLAQILMAAHNPTTPKLGPGQARAAREVDTEIKTNVRLLCGIAEV